MKHLAHTHSKWNMQQMLAVTTIIFREAQCLAQRHTTELRLELSPLN